MNHQRKSARGKGLQITKALQLPVSFFNAGAQAIRLAGTGRFTNGRRIEQHPVVRMSVGIRFSVDQDVKRDGVLGFKY